jgi:hypothetical protein
MFFAPSARWLATRLAPVPHALAPCRFMWLALVLASLFAPATAAAQATSWLYVGGGVGVVDRDEQEKRSTVQLDTGLGTSAEHALVVGGIFRLQGYMGAGADLGVAARVVTRGFAIGGFGAGIDAGMYQRWWGADSTGFTGNLLLGAPWGITLLGGASLGTGDQRIYFASLGIDLARLTVHRHSGLDWFANPMRSPGE